MTGRPELGLIECVTPTTQAADKAGTPTSFKLHQPGRFPPIQDSNRALSIPYSKPLKHTPQTCFTSCQPPASLTSG